MQKRIKQFEASGLHGINNPVFPSKNKSHLPAAKHFI